MNGPVYIGVDTGSSATKCAVVDAQGNLLGRGIAPSGFDYAIAAEVALMEALRDARVFKTQCAGCVATGYGRDRVTWASKRITEITCHARGAHRWYPEVRAIIDIGGQDTKIIRLNARGRTADYRMNAKCAAGTGTFLESIAVRMAVPLAEIDALAMHSTRRLALNSYCTVFTSTEVLERIKDGEPKQDIAMGLFRAIASRVVEMMTSLDGPIAATGGVVTHCQAMVRALEEALQTKLLLPPYPQFAGAFGAAILAIPSEESPPEPTLVHSSTVPLGGVEARPC
jgi:(R)-2-hydroxyacyl-CoA dehydratese activating ATPase